MDRGTPTLVVSDPCGSAVRAIAYCRQSASEAPQARITQTIHDRHSRSSHSRDPRLFALSQDDPATPANQTSVTSMSGALLLSVNSDAGWRLNLSSACGQPLENWDQKRNHRRVTYDQWLRPAFMFEQVAGEEARRSEGYSYADASDASALHNFCGQLIRHDDTGGTQSLDECSLFGSPLEQSRRFLKELDLPDWPEDLAEREVLLEIERATTRNGYNAAGEQIRHIDALGNEQLLRQTRAGELFETCLRLSGAGGYTSLVSDICYSATGQIEQQTAGNGVVTRSAFDAQSGQIISLIAQVASKPPLQQLTYAYDAVGNLLSISDAAQPIRYFRNQRVAPLNTYRYNTLYELIAATGQQCVNAPGGPQLPEFISTRDSTRLENYQQTFDYDSGGNLLTLQHIADSGQRTERTAIAAYSNRSLPYTAADVCPGEGDIAAGYDGNGNLNVLQKGQNLLWNGRDQLRQVDQVIRNAEPNDAERYIYDGGGQRVRKIRTAYSSRRTRTHETRYLSGVEIRTTPEEILHVISVAAGRCTVQILHWEKGRPVGIPDDQARYILTNHLNSNSLELDADARLISQESYYPYGGTASYAGRDKVEASYRTVRYSGQERDATGLYYYGFRYYMPWRQRWLSADPAGVSDGLNLYRMVGGNPIGFVDAQGLEETPVTHPVTGSEYGRAALTAGARGAVKGLIRYGAGKAAGAVLSGASKSVLMPLAANFNGLAWAYSGGSLAKLAYDSYYPDSGTSLGRAVAFASGALPGFAIGYSTALFSDPLAVLVGVSKDFSGELGTRLFSPIGPKIQYNGDATVVSQLVDSGGSVINNVVEGVLENVLADSLPEGVFPMVNGAIKGFITTSVLATSIVPASYYGSKHGDLVAHWKDLPNGLKAIGHDLAVGVITNEGNALINEGFIKLGSENLPGALKAGLYNLQVVSEANALGGEYVLKGIGWTGVSAVSTVTTPSADSEKNMQAAADRQTRQRTSVRRNSAERAPLRTSMV